MLRKIIIANCFKSPLMDFETQKKFVRATCAYYELENDEWKLKDRYLNCDIENEKIVNFFIQNGNKSLDLKEFEFKDISLKKMNIKKFNETTSRYDIDNWIIGASIKNDWIETRAIEDIELTTNTNMNDLENEIANLVNKTPQQEQEEWVKEQFEKIKGGWENEY